MLNAVLLKTFQRKQINSDVVEYYSFVTAAFECNDLSFTSDCPKIYFANTTKDGRKVNKRSVGMAFMYLPWYGLSQLHAFALGIKDDGYTKRTESWLIIGNWIYLMIGMFYLAKSLSAFVSIRYTYAAVLLLLTCTNLIWYSNGEVLFTHAVNFMWVSLLIYFTIRYHINQIQQYVVLMAIAIGMLAIIRPNNIIFILIPVLYNIYNRESLLLKIQLIREQWQHILLAASIIFFIAVPQLLYWKFATGNWIYYSYQGEFFYWGNPRVIDFLFSFRKGWFIYTPVMVFSIIGMFRLPAELKPFKWLLFILVPLFIYVCSCWWAWSYGGCYGMRPMVDLYPLLAFPLVALVNLRKWLMAAFIIPILLSLVMLNYFQSWQYNKGILHYDQMNFEVYKSIWMKTKYPMDYDLLISYPDNEKEARGEGSFYSISDITHGKAYIKYIRSGYLQMDTSNTNITSASSMADAGGIGFIYDATTGSYYIKHLSTNLFLTVNIESSLIEVNQSDLINADRFKLVFLGENKFALQAENGFYISSSGGNGHYLKADALTINPTSIFTMKIHP